jgi:hypothetical protein
VTVWHRIKSVGLRVGLGLPEPADPDRLAGAGVPVELRRFPGQIHGFFNVVGVGRTSRAAVAEIAVKLKVALA